MLYSVKLPSSDVIKKFKEFPEIRYCSEIFGHIVEESHDWDALNVQRLHNIKKGPKMNVLEGLEIILDKILNKNRNLNSPGS